MEKTNLTLRIDKEVVDKARKLGLNLSSITESFLKMPPLIKDDELVTSDKLREAYARIFIELKDILANWGVYLQISEFLSERTYIDSDGKKRVYEETHSLYLSPEGRIELLNDEIEEHLGSWSLNESWPIANVYEPEKIIETLINRLYAEADSNRAKVEKLSMLSNVLKALKADTKKEGEDDGQKI